jgi:hypothetical protein
LVERLVEQDHAGDPSLAASGGEEELTVCAPVCLGRLDPDRLESPCDRAGALVGRQDALARCDERFRSGRKVGCGHVSSERGFDSIYFAKPSRESPWLLLPIPPTASV